MVMNRTSAADVSIQAVSPVSIFGGSGCAIAGKHAHRKTNRNKTMGLARFINLSFAEIRRTMLSEWAWLALYFEARLLRLVLGTALYREVLSEQQNIIRRGRSDIVLKYR